MMLFFASDFFQTYWAERMKGLLVRIRHLVAHKPQAWIGLLIFCTCAFVYWANGETISSTDNASSSLLAFNWLDRHSLNFDVFRGGYMYRTDTKHGPDGIPHFFVETARGHVSSTYPIGNAVLTFPVYFLFFIAIKIAEFYQSFQAGQTVDLLNLTDQAFEGALQHYEKLAAISVASFSAVIFYFINRLKFNGAIALFSTFIFAFATSTWMTGSQGLWQHGSSNLVVLCIIFCLFKANRSEGKNRKILLVLTGIFCGLLPGVRSTSLLYAVGAIVYAVWIYRREALYLLLGLPSILISASWNIYYFGFGLSKLVIGGYSRYDSADTSFTDSYFIWTGQQFLRGFLGLLVSPSRGLFVFTPVSLVAVPGLRQLWAWRSAKDEKLLLCLTVAAIGIFFQYCFFRVWTAGACYGTRYLTDILPVLCLLISYGIAGAMARWQRGQHRFPRLKLAVLTGLIVWSTFTQAVGAFGSTNWDGIPVGSEERVWQWSDNQIQRHANHVFYKAFNPTKDRQTYLEGWNGAIESVEKGNAKPIPDLLVGTPSRKMVLAAQVKNLGTVPWLGYETGLNRGLTRVGVEFLDSANQPVRIRAGNRSRLYLTSVQPGQTARAIGRVTFPPKPGDYQLVLELGVGGLKPLSTQPKPRYVIKTRVVEQEVEQE
jgi:hypothetical protein